MWQLKLNADRCPESSTLLPFFPDANLQLLKFTQEWKADFQDGHVAKKWACPFDCAFYSLYFLLFCFSFPLFLCFAWHLLDFGVIFTVSPQCAPIFSSVCSNIPSASMRWNPKEVAFLWFKYFFKFVLLPLLFPSKAYFFTEALGDHLSYFVMHPSPKILLG